MADAVVIDLRRVRDFNGVEIIFDAVASIDLIEFRFRHVLGNPLKQGFACVAHYFCVNYRLLVL